MEHTLEYMDDVFNDISWEALETVCNMFCIRGIEIEFITLDRYNLTLISINSLRAVNMYLIAIMSAAVVMRTVCCYLKWVEMSG